MQLSDIPEFLPLYALAAVAMVGVIIDPLTMLGHISILMVVYYTWLAARGQRLMERQMVALCAMWEDQPKMRERTYIISRQTVAEAEEPAKKEEPVTEPAKEEEPATEPAKEEPPSCTTLPAKTKEQEPDDAQLSAGSTPTH